MIGIDDIVRIEMGSFVPPAAHRLGGLVISVQIYAIRHPDGLFLWDTGLGEDAEQDAAMRITRRELPAALAAAGIPFDDVALIANCHMHFDHAGQNFRAPRVPILVQREEMNLVGTPDYTIPRCVADFDGAKLEPIDGEATPLPGLRLIRTPGHTDGHQSLLVSTNDGLVLLAGQSFNFAMDFAQAAHAVRGGLDTPPVPDWLRGVYDLDIEAAMFAHDAQPWLKPITSTPA